MTTGVILVWGVPFVLAVFLAVRQPPPSMVSVASGVFAIRSATTAAVVAVVAAVAVVVVVAVAVVEGFPWRFFLGTPRLWGW